MNILEKNGKPIAVVLTTASALAAGVSVYTAVSAQKHSAHPVAKAAAKARTFAELSDQYYIDENEQTDWSEVSADAAEEFAADSVDENTAQIPEQSVEEETIAVESDQIQPETAPVSAVPAVDADAVLDVQPLAYEQIALPDAALTEAPVSDIDSVYAPVQPADDEAVEAQSVEAAYEEAAADVQIPVEAADAAEETPVMEIEAPAAEEAAAAQTVEAETPAVEEAPVADEQLLSLDAPVALEEAGAEPGAEATAEESYPAPIAEEALPNPVGEEIADTQPIVDVTDPAVDADLSGEGVNAGAPIYGETLSSPTLDVQQPVEEVPNAQYADLNARIAEEALKLVGTTDGLQCTEVVQMAMANAGVVDAQSLWPRLYADTYGHVTDSPEPGNLIYYNQGGDGLDHIAVYIGDDQAVHGNYDEGDGVSRTVIASAQVQGCTDYSYIQVER